MKRSPNRSSPHTPFWVTIRMCRWTLPSSLSSRSCSAATSSPSAGFAVLLRILCFATPVRVRTTRLSFRVPRPRSGMRKGSGSSAIPTRSRCTTSIRFIRAKRFPAQTSRTGMCWPMTFSTARWRPSIRPCAGASGRSATPIRRSTRRLTPISDGCSSRHRVPAPIRSMSKTAR